MSRTTRPVIAPCSALLLLTILCIATGTATGLSAAEVELNGHRFHLTDGLQIELVAGTPLVMRPICADFDEQGRLYVADSSGSNDPVKVQLEQKPHRIVRLEDSDGDGQFDKSVVFADAMMFPEGVLWHRGSLYVAAPPSIWKLTDRDGDGVADQREEWFEGKTLTGCANDLHGPYLGPDGWIYWCKGAFASQTYEIPGRSQLVTRAAHVFRRHPTKHWVEPVMAGGMDNPVELVFTPAGEPIFTTTFLQHPGGGRRDGLIHAVYGGVYGKVHDVIEGHPRTGDIMPPLTHLGPAAPCGLTRLESSGLGNDYAHNLLACLFNMHKVTRHVVQRNGAALSTVDEDFLISDNIDFHPTDVLEDADGSVLVVDTGGWYKICCPTSHLYKPDVLGAIYRVRRTTSPAIEDARGLKLAWGDKVSPEALAKRLSDARFAVRQRAMNELALQGDAAVDAIAAQLAGDAAPATRLAAVWTLGRIDSTAARAAGHAALSDHDEDVVQAAAHVCGLWQDASALHRLLPLLESEQPATRRVAAQALGRLQQPAAVPALLKAAQTIGDDRTLEHSLIYALMEIGDVDATRAGLTAEHVNTRRAALIALDQMPGAELSAERVAALLESDQALLRETAGWIVERHPEWAAQVAGLLKRRLTQPTLDETQSADLERYLVRFAAHGEIQQTMADMLSENSSPWPRKQLVLHAISRTSMKSLPTAWVGALEQLLQSSETQAVSAAVSTLLTWRQRGTPVKELREPLLAVAQRADIPDDVRLQALAALEEAGDIGAPLAGFVISQLDEEKALEHRLRAADVLAGAQLSRAQLDTLLDRSVNLGPMELGRLLPAFARSKDDVVGLQLVDTLEKAPSIGGVPVAILRGCFEQFGEPVKLEADRIYKIVDADLEKQRAYFDEIFPKLEHGDVRRGQAIFYGSKAACSACHAIGYLGGDIGPDLTRIARIRAPHDLLESILFPNASFVRSYEPVAVVTHDGLIHNGVIRNEGAEELTLALAADKFITIPRDEIEQIQPSKTSIMPAGLDKQLSEQELADLLAFLKASK